MPYVVATARRSIEPNALAWLGWAVLDAIVFVAQIVSEPSWSAVFPGAGAAGCLAIALVTIRAGRIRTASRGELACGAFGVLAIVGWQVTGDPQVALGLAIAASLVMSAPMLVKTAKDPASEPIGPFIAFAVVSALSIVSATRFDFLSLGWPASYLAFQLTILAITIAARIAARNCAVPAHPATR
ncbi:MAG: hypothetical protein ACRDLP_11050 [Solirubrobacteraceae bacterium]